MNNSIYIRRKRKVYLERGLSTLKKGHIAALNINIESLGYTLSTELITILETLSVDELKNFYNSLITDLKIMVGSHVVYEPMYPNFPEQVMEASQAELYLNAMMHYLGDWIGLRILPHYQKKERDNLQDNIKLKVIGFGNRVEFEQIFTNLISSKTSVSEQDKLDIELYVKDYKDTIFDLIPKEIPSKENIALLGSLIIENTTIAKDFLIDYIKTATDVLRLSVALSKGDISLAESTKLRSFSKNERRILLSLLENCNKPIEDMLRFKERWKRLGEKLHPFDYRTKYPNCFEAFDTIRNNKPYTTFNSKVEASLLSADFERTAALLKDRPGEFARRLDNLLRLSKNKEGIVAIFKELAPNVSTPVLLSLIAHFKHRNSPTELRTFFPKGNIFKAKAIKYNLPDLDKVLCSEIVSICEAVLIEKYSRLPSLGNVFLDDKLKDFTVPFALRSASKALKTVSRGSRIDLPAGNTLRFFIWWKDGKDRTDLDLSAVGLDENHAYKVQIAYYNLKELGGCHSGDITSAPEGASEFIDIDMASFLKAGIRFVVMSVNSYTSQPFYELPECFAGFMIRQFPNSGEIYEPKTVENKFDLTGNTKISIPFIIDLLERKVFWTDISLKAHPYYNNNVYNNMSSIAVIAKSMTSLIKPNLFELFDLHIKARGNRVSNIADANVIFALHQGITPYDIEEIISNYI